MTILAIDMMTARTRLACGNKYQEYPESRDQAETLPRHIEQVIHDAQIDYKDLTAIVCLTGPGSFTGIRVALSSAHALGFSLHIPVVGLRADEAFSLSLDNKSKAALILDTRRKDFAVAFRNKNEETFDDFQELDTKALLSMMDGHIICGNGAQKAGLSNVSMIDPDLISIVHKIDIKDDAYNPESAQSFYLRAPDVTLSPQKFEHQALYNSQENIK